MRKMITLDCFLSQSGEARVNRKLSQVLHTDDHTKNRKMHIKIPILFIADQAICCIQM